MSFGLMTLWTSRARSVAHHDLCLGWVEVIWGEVRSGEKPRVP